MKKILLTLAIVMMFGFGANAQQDGYFRGGDDGGGYDRDDETTLPFLPRGGVGSENNDQPGAPLGSGLLILTALGMGYAFSRKGEK